MDMKYIPKREQTANATKSKLIETSIGKSGLFHELVRKSKITRDSETENTKELYRKAAWILECLLTKSDVSLWCNIYSDILMEDVDGEDSLNGVVELIFERALGDLTASAPCANLCKSLMQRKLTLQGKVCTYSTIPAHLLDICRREFTALAQSDADIATFRNKCDTMGVLDFSRAGFREDMKINKILQRKRTFFRFIEELFKLRLVPETLVHDSLLTLIPSIETDGYSVECLWRLLTNLGKYIDHEKSKDLMDGYFCHIEDIMKKNADVESSSHLLLLQDLVQLRKNKWVPVYSESIGRIHEMVSIEERVRDTLACIFSKKQEETWTGGQSVTKLVSKRKTNETSASRTKDKIKQYDRTFLLMRKEQCSRKPDSLPSISELISSLEKMLYLKSNCDMENDVLKEKELLELDVKDCGAEQHSYQAYTKLSRDDTIRKPSHHGRPRIQYDRNSLLELRFKKVCLMKPKNLQGIFDVYHCKPSASHTTTKEKSGPHPITEIAEDRITFKKKPSKDVHLTTETKPTKLRHSGASNVELHERLKKNQTVTAMTHPVQKENTPRKVDSNERTDMESIRARLDLLLLQMDSDSD